MIIEKILNKIDKSKFKNKKDLKEDLTGGLIFGLIGGLTVGLISGLTVGLIFGLGYVINFFAFLGLASLISHYPTFLPLWLFFIIGIIFIELFFWMDEQKPKKGQSKFWFTTLKKGEAILESMAVLGFLNLIRLGINKIRTFQNWDLILKWIGYIGAGLIALVLVAGVIYIYIKLNSLKYKN